MTIDAKIASMQDRGILTQEQAERLTNALDRKKTEPAIEKRKWPLLTILLVVMVVSFVGLLLAAIFSPQEPEIIQNVSSALNQPEEIGKMNSSISRGLSFALLLILPVIALLIWAIWVFNNLASREEVVFESWAQVESNYQRRADLIPNIVEAASDYMDYERSVLLSTTNVRTKAANQEHQETIDELRGIIEEITTAQNDANAVLDRITGAPNDQKTIARLIETQSLLEASMMRVVALAENYPNLQSGDQVLALQAALEGTENRINVARMRFNEAASDYNAAIRRMPTSLIASAGDFKRKAYFTSEVGANSAVDIDLD